MPLQGVSQRAFAKLDGCARPIVAKGLKSGALRVLDDGSIDPQLAGTNWRSGNYKPGQGGKLPPTARQLATQTTVVTTPPEPSRSDLEARARAQAGSTPLPPLEESVRGKEHYTHLLKKLEHDERRKLLISSRQAEVEFGRECAILRTRLRAIPSTIAPRLARISNPAVIHDTLLDYIDEVLNELADAPPLVPSGERA